MRRVGQWLAQLILIDRDSRQVGIAPADELRIVVAAIETHWRLEYQPSGEKTPAPAAEVEYVDDLGAIDPGNGEIFQHLLRSADSATSELFVIIVASHGEHQSVWRQGDVVDRGRRGTDNLALRKTAPLATLFDSFELQNRTPGNDRDLNTESAVASRGPV